MASSTEKDEGMMALDNIRTEFETQLRANRDDGGADFHQDIYDGMIQDQK